MVSISWQPLAGRVAIVTGSSRGIGRNIASHLHSLGANVVVNYVSSSAQAQSLVDELNESAPAARPRAISVRADVSSPDDVKLLFDRAEQHFNSPVHILVNNAGVMNTSYPCLGSTTLEDFDYVYGVNTRGAFLCCREAANRVAPGGGGRIIIITTSATGNLLPGYSVYASSKAAIETMAKILAKELRGKRITVNCVSPGPVNTELFAAGKTEEMIKSLEKACPLGRIGDPKDISGIVGFLASNPGEWINGQVIKANGGFIV